MSKFNKLSILMSDCMSDASDVCGASDAWCACVACSRSSSIWIRFQGTPRRVPIFLTKDSFETTWARRNAPSWRGPSWIGPNCTWVRHSSNVAWDGPESVCEFPFLLRVAFFFISFAGLWGSISLLVPVFEVLFLFLFVSVFLSGDWRISFLDLSSSIVALRMGSKSWGIYLSSISPSWMVTPPNFHFMYL